ncbi:MAG: PIG-L family deacetylase [Gemmatimonadales bacterium]
MKRGVIAFVALMSVIAPRFLHGQDRGASVPRRVLVIAAHPDDEDTQLITWLSRGGRAATAYLSLTRGDGGQNLIGNELGEQLGVIRTEELLAARRVDGAHQFFARAYDFGFSKTADETFAHWPKDSVLGDVVTVIRSWRPQVIVAVFSGTPKDGHGQHQVSAILAKEAYESAAADTVRFPVSKFGAAWTPLKFYRFAGFNLAEPTLRINVGEYNSKLGKSYAEIAAESRSQHKSQGFGSLQRKGPIWDQLRRESSRVNASTPAASETSIFDGIPEPVKPDPTSVSDISQRVKDISLDAVADRQYVALGDSARVTATLYNRSREPVEMLRINQPNVTLSPEQLASVRIPPDSSYRWAFYVYGGAITQPWWLVTPRHGDLFTPKLPLFKDTTRWDLTPEDEREKHNWITVLVGGDQAAIVRTPIVYHYADPVRGDIQRPLAVAPALSVTLDRAVELARANTLMDRYFNVKLKSAVMSRKPVTVTLNLPAGLSGDSASRTITLDSAGSRTVTFRVRGKLSSGTHALSAVGTMDGTTYSNGYIPIEYEHITPERIYRPSTVTISAIDAVVPASLKVAYIPGVGDNVEPTLVQLGIPVTTVQPSEIPTVDLSRFSTVVVGPRAYQASRELIDNNPYLLAYAKNGGTLVVQYGQYEMTGSGMMPYPVTLSRPADRITEEVAPLTILDAASPAFNYPNKITLADFDGWVQERSLYMPHTFDSHYHALISGNDPGAPSNSGMILVTPYGKGLYVYTTLAFFRQLPAGVPGGTRLFVNLLSMKAPGR